MKTKRLCSPLRWMLVLTCFGLIQVSTAFAEQTDEPAVKDQRAVKLLKRKWRKFLRTTNRVLEKHQLSHDSAVLYIEERQRLQNAVLGSTDADPSFVADYFCDSAASDKQSD